MNARLTRCPACATVFRVLPEQLESRQGFVRCGQCAKVFDARASLTEEQALTLEPSGFSEGDLAGTPNEPPTALDAAPRGPTLASDPPATAGKQGTDWPFVPPTPGERPGSDAADPAPEGASVDSSSAEAAAANAPEAVAPTDSAPASPASEPAYSLSDVRSARPSDFEFGPKHRSRSRRASIAWGLGSVLLLAALAAQGAYWFRTELTAAVPEARPYLEAACARLGCSVPPARQTALITIEADEMEKDFKSVPGLHVLTLTLRNRARFAQAYPHIELTLADSDWQPLSRKVVEPQQYLGPASEIVFPPVSERTVRVFVDASGFGSRELRYRVSLHHP